MFTKYFGESTIVRLSGGLGNQLFQICNAQRVADLHQGKIVLDLSWFKYNYMRSRLVSSRNYESDYFPEIAKLPKYFAKFPRLDNKVGSVQRRLTGPQQKFLRIMSVQNQHLFKRMPVLIDGVFASKQFIPSKNVLSKLLQFPLEASSWLEDTLGDLVNASSVAVHVRMGDYLKLADIYGVLGIEFYRVAVDRFRADNPEVEFHLFSDSPEDASNWLKPIVAFNKVIDTPANSPAAETLRLMSSYKGLIASNSTFSWWAGYLGTSTGTMKKVIIPKKFTNLVSDDVMSDYLLDTWDMF